MTFQLYRLCEVERKRRNKLRLFSTKMGKTIAKLLNRQGPQFRRGWMWHKWTEKSNNSNAIAQIMVAILARVP